jgi:hypothetical protein
LGETGLYQDSRPPLPTQLEVQFASPKSGPGVARFPSLFSKATEELDCPIKPVLALEDAVITVGIEEKRGKRSNTSNNM